MTETVAPSIEDGIKFEPIHDLFPSLDFFLLKSVVMKDPLCSYADLQNGSISMLDLFFLNEMADLRGELNGRR